MKAHVSDPGQRAAAAELALHGGKPVRDALLPYGRQHIDEADIAAVADVLRGDWLTTGPTVAEFEARFAAFVGAKEAVAVNSGTAALHAAMAVLDIGAGDEVIVTPMTFAASANCVLYVGARPVFADVDPSTLLIDPNVVAALVTARTKAIVAVDYAGQPCDYAVLQTIADAHGLALVADACHAPGATYRDRPVGTLADLNTFSLHPVKHFTTAEGGLVTTNSSPLAVRMRHFRNHGISTDHRQRAANGAWFYEMVQLGYNYRLPDVNCALGISQLARLPHWIARRQALGARYRAQLANEPAVQMLAIPEGVTPSWHIFPIMLNLDVLTVDRATIFAALRAENIGVNVHYIPVYWHPFYEKLGYLRGLCPHAEQAYARLITLPLFPDMSDRDLDDVVTAVKKVTGAFRR